MLIDPKYAHSVGAAVRAASCYGIGQVWFTGDRVQLVGERRLRLSREERMRGYQDIELCHADLPFDAFDKGAVPVAVELRRNVGSRHRAWSASGALRRRPRGPLCSQPANDPAKICHASTDFATRLSTR